MKPTFYSFDCEQMRILTIMEWTSYCELSLQRRLPYGNQLRENMNGYRITSYMMFWGLLLHGHELTTKKLW